MAALSPNQRKSLARKAAKARWGKDGMPAKKRTKRSPNRSRNTYADALIQAQQQLAEAQQQLGIHQFEYNRLRQEIPALMRTVQALQALNQPQSTPQSYPGPQLGYYPPEMMPQQPQSPPLPPNYSLDTVMSDAPLTSADPNAMPSMTFVMPPVPPAVPPARPPMPSMTEMPKPPLPMRGGGGAVGQTLEEEDENQFLSDKMTNAAQAGGEWH